VGGVRFIQIARGFRDDKVHDDWHIDNRLSDSPFYGIDKDGKMPPKFGPGGQNDEDGWTYIIDRPNVQFENVKKLPTGEVVFPFKPHWEFVTVAVCPKTKQIMAAVHFFLPVSKGPGPTFHGKDSDDWWKKWNELTGNEYSQK
jgi:hypothetical protein